MKSFLICFVSMVLTGTTLAASLETIFGNPPAEARPRVMWMWMGSQISKECVTADLEALKDAGFGGTVMFSVADTTSPWPCPIENRPGPDLIAFTDPWWEMVKFAASESQRLGLDFGMASSPGYSTSGGPWIAPEHSMLQVCYSESRAQGPGKIKVDLPQPTVDPHAVMTFPVWNPASGEADKPEIAARKSFYRDIATLAMPASGNVRKDQVYDLTGKSEWEAPAGQWVIYRFGYTTKGILLQPPQWEANGLECDKLNPDAVEFHLHHVINEIQKHLGGLVGNGFNFVHIDSYEAGVPEWTPRMREEFSKRRGYDLTPYLGKFAKRVIGDASEMKKFEGDLQETVRDLFRDNYYGIAQKMLNEAGLAFSSEPYGGLWRQEDVLPRTDRVMTEFWTSNGKIRFRNQPTVEWMHKNDRNLIEAEAFTGSPVTSKWTETPEWLKPFGDAAFCAGINRLVLHRYTPQPWAEKYRPGNAMGQWGTHFDRTQTWWEPGKAMFLYWQRCQAMLQWGKYAPLDFTTDEGIDLQAIHRQGDEGDLWFIANSDQIGGASTCTFNITGKQPELWDAVTGTKRDLPDFVDTGTQTTIVLEFAPTQSCFVVFRKPGKPVVGNNFATLVAPVELSGAWDVHFDPKWGGPEKITFDELSDWTLRPEPGIKYYSGTATYRKTFDGNTGTVLDLGTVNCIARVKLNGQDLGVAWCAPWTVRIPRQVLKETSNQLEIEITNVWANRLIGDEQEPPDCEWKPGHRGGGNYLARFPDWLVKGQPRPSKGRYCFTTWNYFKNDSKLSPSGLIGPVRVLSEDWKSPRPKPQVSAVLSRTGPSLEADVVKENLVKIAKCIEESVAHDGGGTNADALFNNTTTNGTGRDDSANDGKTYRGYGQGSSLTLILAKPTDIARIRTFAGHGDGRGSQSYTVHIARADAPDRFEKLTSAKVTSTGGASELRIKVDATNVTAIRFEFHDGPLGFNVYREINIIGAPAH